MKELHVNGPLIAKWFLEMLVKCGDADRIYFVKDGVTIGILDGITEIPAMDWLIERAKESE